MKYIEGQDRAQITMLPAVMDDYVAEDHPVRVIDAFVGSLDMMSLGFERAVLKDTGRPPYAPQDLLKLYIYGYFNKIRSSRRLEKECYRNLEVIWLLKNLRPDHKTISRFRHDNPAALRNTFRAFVKLCDRCGLYGKELFSIDGSRFSAVNSKDRNFNEQKLKERIANIESRLEVYLAALDENDADDTGEDSGIDVHSIVKELEERRGQYNAMIAEMRATGQTQVSLTDPDSRRMNRVNQNVMIGYNVQTAVDGKNGLIAEYEVTNSSSDMGLLYGVAAKAKDVLHIENQLDLIADKGYNSASDIAKCETEQMTAHVCMEVEGIDICIETDELVEKPVTQANGRVVYLESRNICICPMGEILYPGYYRRKRRYAKYYNYTACKKCTCRCTKSPAGKEFEISMPPGTFTKEYNAEGLRVKQVRITPNRELLKRRKSLSEHPFGMVKRDMDAGYLLTRGLRNVDGEFALAFMVFNMKRALTLLGAEKLIQEAGAV